VIHVSEIDPMPEIRARAAANKSAINTVIEEVERSEERRRRQDLELRRRRLRETSGVPRIFADAALERIDVEPGNSDAVHAAAFVVEQNFETSLALSGSDATEGHVGNSKSTIACAIVNAAIERCVPAKFSRAVSIFDELFEASRYGSDIGVIEAQQRLARVNVLVIDDLGRERLDARTLAWLHDLLDRRWCEKRPLLVTTNLSFTQLHDRYTSACRRYGELDSTADGILDRLRGLIPIDRWVQVTGQSRRGR
jgi:DNA replication protein DnaC